MLESPKFLFRLVIVAELRTRCKYGSVGEKMALSFRLTVSEWLDEPLLGSKDVNVQ